MSKKPKVYAIDEASNISLELGGDLSKIEGLAGSERGFLVGHAKLLEENQEEYSKLVGEAMLKAIDEAADQE